MSAPPRADFVAGCPDCGKSKEANSLEAVAYFYVCHHGEGHDVEWMWGNALSLNVDPIVTRTGSVANLPTVIRVLEDHFEPAAVPGELLYETCLNAGATKRALDDQLKSLPTSVADRVTPIE
jgi:hypothetical protein